MAQTFLSMSKSVVKSVHLVYVVPLKMKGNRQTLLGFLEESELVLHCGGPSTTEMKVHAIHKFINNNYPYQLKGTFSISRYLNHQVSKIV